MNNKEQNKSFLNNSKSYQQMYSDTRDENKERKLKRVGSVAAGLGLSVLGGGLAPDTSADTIDTPLQKELKQDILANKESTAIELSDSRATTEEGSNSDQPSESQSDSGAASETQSEVESRVDVSTVPANGWNGNTWTMTINPGDLRSIGNTDYTQARGSIVLTLNSDGTISIRANITNITRTSFGGYFSFSMGGDANDAINANNLISAAPVVGGTVNYSQILTPNKQNTLYFGAQQNSPVFLYDVDGGASGGYAVGAFGMSSYQPVLAFSMSLSSSMSDSVSTSASVSTSESLNAGRSESQSASESDSISLSDSISNSVSLSHSNSLSVRVHQTVSW